MHRTTEEECPDCSGFHRCAYHEGVRHGKKLAEQEFTSNREDTAGDGPEADPSGTAQVTTSDRGSSPAASEYDPHEPIDVRLSRDEANTLLNIADAVRQALDKGDAAE